MLDSWGGKKDFGDGGIFAENCEILINFSQNTLFSLSEVVKGAALVQVNTANTVETQVASERI